MGVPEPATQAILLYDFEANQQSVLLAINQVGQPSSLYAGMSISADGRFTAVTLLSDDLLGAPFTQIAVLDRSSPGALTVVSRNNGVIGNANSAWPKISGDGRYVSYSTLAPNLTQGEASQFAPILMVADLLEGTSTIASRRTNGTSLTTGTFANNEHAISRDGSRIAFVTSYDTAFGNGVPTFETQVFAAPRP
jgi:Tol biopolymer transport system component